MLTAPEQWTVCGVPVGHGVTQGRLVEIEAGVERLLKLPPCRRSRRGGGPPKVVEG
jgi:hypothetical protein